MKVSKFSLSIIFLIITVAIIAIVQASLTGFFFISPPITQPGTNFDTGSCISKSFLDTSGTNFDFGGSIGCPVEGPALLPAGVCNFNKICENLGAVHENQLFCGKPEGDCGTNVSIIPSPVFPLQQVLVTIEFEDWRYVKNGPVMFNLTIRHNSVLTAPYPLKWNSTNGCSIGEVKLNAPFGANVVSENGHFKISSTCTMPANVIPGPHNLTALPTIF